MMLQRTHQRVLSRHTNLPLEFPSAAPCQNPQPLLFTHHHKHPRFTLLQPSLLRIASEASSQTLRHEVLLTSECPRWPGSDESWKPSVLPPLELYPLATRNAWRFLQGFEGQLELAAGNDKQLRRPCSPSFEAPVFCRR